MKWIITLMVWMVATNANAQAPTTGTNTMIQQQEAIEQRRAQDRQELNRAADASAPNAKSAPTKVDVSSWGIDPNVKFEITNHLLGYSTILEKDQTLQGLKITGLINFAYYNVKKKVEDGSRSKARYVFGFETPIYDLTNRTPLWAGIGATLGDTRSIYGDIGLDLILTSWFKLQGGINWNGETGFNPQISAGFVW